MRIGMGFDVHQLVEGRKLILGGVEIPYPKGLLGHSDADVLTHSVMDAILGALGEGDIGVLFPDTDSKYKDISSLHLLDEVVERMREKNYRIGNIDITVVAQEPKLRPYIEQIEDKLALHLDTTRDRINVKATTTEELGYEGRKEGMSAYAVCLIENN